MASFLYPGGMARRLPEGQLTQQIYTMIGEQNYKEAIAHLVVELQVCNGMMGALACPAQCMLKSSNNQSSQCSHGLSILSAELPRQQGSSVPSWLQLLLQWAI
jgi:hypothetical protein